MGLFSFACVTALITSPSRQRSAATPHANESHTLPEREEGNAVVRGTTAAYPAPPTQFGARLPEAGR